jgi:hypothetical protein
MVACRVGDKDPDGGETLEGRRGPGRTPIRVVEAVQELMRRREAD